MAKKWEYSDCRTGRHGLMVCCTCHADIDTGEYRYRMNSKYTAYITEHRKCSEDDPVWVRLDHKMAQQVEECRQRLIAFKKFREEWDVSELDDQIEEMEFHLRINE